MPSNCTIELLLNVCEYVYADYAELSPAKKITDQKNQSNNPHPQEKELEKSILNSQYRVYAAKSFKGIGTIHDTGLNEYPGLGYGVFVPLEPENNNEPIIIAYRGSYVYQDVLEDVKIGLTGATGKQYQEEAYNVYLAVRKQWPNRNIVLTGHSLGGYMANYIGQRASAEKDDEQLIHVRTFNSPGLHSNHENNMVSHNKKLKQPNVFHYSLWADPLRLTSRTGQHIICFKESRIPTIAHSLNSLMADIPDEIKAITVGLSSIEAMKEAIIGFTTTYDSTRTTETVPPKNYTQYAKSFFFNFLYEDFLLQEPFFSLETLKSDLLLILGDETLDQKSRLQKVEQYLSIYKANIDKFKSIFNNLSDRLGPLIDRCKQYQAPSLMREVNILKEENLLCDSLQRLIINAIESSAPGIDPREVINKFDKVQLNLLKKLHQLIDQTKNFSTKDIEGLKDYFIEANLIMLKLLDPTQVHPSQKADLHAINNKLQEYFKIFYNTSEVSKILNSKKNESAKLQSNLNEKKLFFESLKGKNGKLFEKISNYIPGVINNNASYHTIKTNSENIIYELKINPQLHKEFPKLLDGMEEIVKSIQRIEHLQNTLDKINKNSATSSLGKLTLHSPSVSNKPDDDSELLTISLDP
nr:Mbeg1-like protein [Legionella brunensis]